MHAFRLQNRLIEIGEVEMLAAIFRSGGITAGPHQFRAAAPAQLIQPGEQSITLKHGSGRQRP
jgi:hypothetical protein